MTLEPMPELPPPALTPRQEGIATRLRQLGEGPSAFFTDACQLLAERPSHGTVTHLVAHLLREVESAMRSVLDPGYKPQDRGHAVSVRAVLDELDISHGDPVAEFWLSLTGKGNAAGMASRAHRSALDAPRDADRGFEDFVQNVEELLDRVTRRFEDRYVGVFGRLDELLAIDRPDAGDAGRLRQQFPQNLATLSYFFAHAGQDWLVPLRGEGFFASPPEPLLHEEEGTAELPFWPQSQFLLKVAPNNAAEVVATALAIPATDNGRVNSDVVELALRVPGNESARLLPRVIGSLDSRFGVLIPGRVGRLCRHLAENGLPEQSMRLADALLGRIPDGSGARARMDSWSYAEVLREDMPAVVLAVGLPALALMNRLLGEAVAARLPERARALREDMSMSWRPVLAGRPPGIDTDPATALVSAVRDAAAQLTESGQATLGGVVAELESHDWPVFRRLALFVLDSHGHGAPELIGAHLCDPAVIGDFNLFREFIALARHHCQAMSEPDQQRLLALIGKGPDTSDWATRYQEQTGRPMSEAMIRDRVSRWQRDRFAAVEPILTPEWKARYQALSAEFGEAEDPAATDPVPVRDITFTSPATAGDLAASPIKELVTFLDIWKPTGQPFGASQFSLASALASSIQQEATQRSSEAEAFIGLQPVYVAAIISGLWQAARGGAALDWAPVLRLCAWADQQATEELKAPPTRARPSWRDTRLNTLRLLASGLGSADNPISAAHRAEAWGIIDSAAQDPDPAPDDEAHASETGQGPGDLVLNHVRPQALNAAISYAWWCRAHDSAADITDALGLLGHHLDATREPSQAVRWVYGTYFPQLTTLDREWAIDNVPVIFPTAETHRQLWEAAWDGYLNRAGVNGDACEILNTSYDFAVGLLDPEASERPELARAHGLGRHLLTQYWAGRITLDSPDQLLRRFFQRAPASILPDLMRYIGRGLSEATALGADLADRLRVFWEARVQAVREGDDPRELREFGEWFAAGKLGDEWELRQLLTALSIAGGIEAEHAVLPRLAALSGTHTSTSLAILNQRVRTHQNSFWLQREESSIRAILKNGLDSGDPADAEVVTAIVSVCMADGLDLRDVLAD
jgi:hypothetical protein